MNKRGPKSPNDLMAVTHETRIGPPATLSDAERFVWLELTNAVPANFFTEIHRPMLEMYCRHVAFHKVLSEQALAFELAWLADPDGLKRYNLMLQMVERESRAASALATRLRITKQATEHRETAGRAQVNHVSGTKPWDRP
jgi:hypothetical protein